MHPLRPLIFLIVFLSLASCQNAHKDETAQAEPPAVAPIEIVKPTVATEQDIAVVQTDFSGSQNTPTTIKPDVFVPLGHSESVEAVAFSPDGKLALSGSWDHTLKLWQVESGREIRTFKGHSNHVNAVAFSPDGKLALSGSRDETLKLWQVSNGREIRTFKGHSDGISSVAFSPDGKLALSGSWQTLKLWQVSTGREIRTFKGHSSDVHAVAFSPDGKLALSGSHDSTLKLWQVSSGREIRTFKGHSFNVNAVAFSPDGKLALSGSWDKTLKLWQVSSGREIRTFKGHSDYVQAVAFSPDGKLALSGSWDKTLKLWQVSSGREIRTFKGDSSSVNAVAFSPDGKLALSGSNDKTLKLWQVSSGREIRTFKGHSSYVNAVAFSPDGKLALSGSNDKTLKLWQVSSGREIRTFGHSSSVNAVAFSPDGKLALSGSYNTLKLWQVSSGREIRTFKGDSNAVNAVAFSPDGKLALSGSGDNSGSYGELKLWQVSSGREIRTFKGHSSDVWSVAFSPDGKLALSGSNDKTLKLWQVESGREIRTFKGHSSTVEAVAFSPDGKLALSGSWDSTTRLWNIQTGKEVAQMVAFDNDEWVTITPEGYYTASLNGAKYINVSIGNQYYSIDQYKALCYRPDIVEQSIKLGDSQKAIAMVTHSAPTKTCIVQPPKIWIVSPESGIETKAASIKVQVKTENTADSADAVTFFVNDRPMGNVKSAATQEDSHTKTIPLVVGENWIKAQVRGKAGATEDTKESLLIIRHGEKVKPDLYYLGIGVAQHPQLSLKYPAKDVKGLETVLKQQQGKAYKRVISKTLTDEQATRDNIIQNVKTFFKPAKQNDIVILFISGHGLNSDNSKPEYYFLSNDADPKKIEDTGVSWKDFHVINELKTNVLLLADTCHAGNIAGNAVWEQRAKVNPDQFLRDSHDNNVIVFASSSGGDFSFEDPKWGHGAFTKALIDGLNGKAADAEGIVDLALLQRYVRKTVEKLTDGAQTPRIPKLIGTGEFLDLVLAKIGENAQSMLDWTQQQLAKLNPLLRTEQ